MYKGLLWLALLLNLLTNSVQAKIGSDDATSRLFIGFKGGINFTFIDATKEFGTLVALPPDENLDFGKTYEPFYNNRGYQFSFMVSYFLTNQIEIDILPTFTTYNYHYSNSLAFYNEGEMFTNQEFEFHQKLRYAEFPVQARFFLSPNKFSPYLFAGGCAGTMLSADKYIEAKDELSGGATTNNDQQVGNSASDFITPRLGAFGGVGCIYETLIVMMTLDIGYKHGFNNITNERNRYQNSLASGFAYDIPDDLRIHQLFVDIGFLFPINKRSRWNSIRCAK